MKLFICDVCESEFKTERGLLNHKCRWCCELCGKKLTTKNGYERHIKNHEKSKEIERIKTEGKIQREMQSILDLQKLKESGLFSPKYNVGDTVSVSTYSVTKPLYEQRYNRMVRVRYEEVRFYYADNFKITEVLEPTQMDVDYFLKYCLDGNRKCNVFYKSGFKKFGEHEIFDNIELAKKDAKEKGDKYNADCEFASMCR